MIPPVHYLIDGYNCAHWLAGDDDLDPEGLRALLLDRLAHSRPRDARALTIYWDSGARQGLLPQNEYGPGCDQRFVPVADDAIVDAVADAERPASLTVVSRDREVAGRSRQLGARTLSPAELLGSR